MVITLAPEGVYSQQFAPKTEHLGLPDSKCDTTQPSETTCQRHAKVATLEINYYQPKKFPVFR